MVVLVVGATYAFFYFRKKLTPKEEPLIIEVEALDPNLSQGYGFIIDGKIILRDNKTPLIMKSKELAEETLREEFHGKGQIVFQKWDVEKQQLILGKVQEHGTN